MSDVCNQRLDIEIVKWVATGPPDSYGRSINAVALAREVLNLRAETDGMRGMLADSIVVHHDDQAEIDALRLRLAWTERISQDRGEENERLRSAVVAFSRLSGCESDCLFDGSEIVHRPCCFRWEP